jgi:superfamily II DNA helicase RecQ
MARKAPRTVDEFAAINGVGAAKLEEFAAPFLAAITDALPARPD